MSKERLAIYEDSCVYRLRWYFPDEDDWGMILGEDLKDLDRADYEAEWDHRAASMAVKGMSGVELDRDGFWWDSKSAAQVALQVARRAIKSKGEEKPWPEWARKALEQGWRPPKGWRP